MDKLILRSDDNGVCILTLNSPGTINALSEGMLTALSKVLDDIAGDRSVKAVILRSAGNHFCAGHNLKEMTAARKAEDGGRKYWLNLFAKCTKMMTSIPKLPQPVICQPHGLATAAGCQLVASCDLAVTDTETKFGVNGVNIGLFCSTPMVALSRNIPRKQAFEMLTTGNFITAKKAMELGLVNRVVKAADLETETNELAQLVASKLGAAVKIGKQAFYEQIQMSLQEAYTYTGEVMANNMTFRDTEEGIAAFLEKRPPEWTQE